MPIIALILIHLKKKHKNKLKEPRFILGFSLTHILKT